MVGINNYIVEGLVDFGVSMFMLAIVVVRELGIMHLVMGSESYKITLSVVTQVFGIIEGLPVWIGETNCNMVLMVVDMDSYNVLLGLDFLIKIGTVHVDIERGLI
jgi:predicted aspartyl protease